MFSNSKKLTFKNIHLSKPNELNYDLFLKPDYLIHPYVSGNKYRKLKYNLLKARELNQTSLLSFGGAFSNHIAAVAACGKEYGLATIGIIRGDELKDKIELNPTLKFAQECGMTFKFVTRTVYRQKEDPSFLNDLKVEFGDFYLLPEGGTNALAIAGCEEILTEEDGDFDFICCSIGTGGTIAGLLNSGLPHQKILGFPALKGDFLQEEISKFAVANTLSLISDYHFGGYAKINSDLVSFINEFKRKYHIPLDPIYTGKMMFGIFDLMKQGYFPKGSKILAIHTGGLQGIEGMNLRLKQKNLPIIE